MSSKDLIIDITEWLKNKNIHYIFDKDNSSYYGYDDIFIIYINNVKFKFSQTIYNGFYYDLVLKHNNQTIFDYNNIIDYLQQNL